MVEALEVMSVEETSSEARRRNRRLLLAVVPVLGVALASAVYMSQGTASTANSISAFERESFLGGDFFEEDSFRTMLTDHAAPSQQKEYPALKTCVPQTEEELERQKCHEDDPSLQGNFPGPNSNLGKILKKDLRYCGFTFREPTSPTSSNRFRSWSSSHSKFYCKENNVSDRGVVTTALRVMELGLNNKEQFSTMYTKTRPGAFVALDWVSAGETWFGGKIWIPYVGMARASSSSRSLYDLLPNMREGPREFSLNLALIVHSALRQLPRFYSQTNYSFHGGINSHNVEVLVDEGDPLPLVAYVTGYADAIAWHVRVGDWKHALELPRHAPPEALNMGSEVLTLSSKFDTWSAGLAMVEMLFRKHEEVDSFSAALGRHKGKMSVWRDLLFLRSDVGLQQQITVTHLERFCIDAMEFVADMEPNLKEVLTNMIAPEPQKRWDVHGSLRGLESLIIKLDEAQAKKESEDNAKKEA